MSDRPDAPLRPGAPTAPRLAIVGLASSHVDQVVRLVAGGVLGEVRLSALCTVTEPWSDDVPPGRAADLVAAAGHAGGPPELLRGSPDDVARALVRAGTDAVVVADRDWRAHGAVALALVRAGLSVLVDKPFVPTVSEAQELLDEGERRGVVVTSFSALRWHAGVRALAEQVRRSPTGVVVTATGPVLAASPAGGAAFYAIHAVEAALTVARGTVDEVGLVEGDGVAVLTARTGQDLVTVVLTEPAGGEQTPFHLSVVAGDRRADRTLVLDRDYLLPGLVAFLDAVRSGRAPVAREQVLGVVRVLEALR